MTQDRRAVIKGMGLGAGAAVLSAMGQAEAQTNPRTPKTSGIAGGRAIEISWPELGVSVRGILAEKQNPELVEEFWQHLPFRTLFVHPVAGGEIMYGWAPIVSTAAIRTRVPVNSAPLGQIRYSPGGGNKFGIQYGESHEPSLTPLLGYVVPEDCHLLRAVGQAIWDNLFWKKRQLFVEVRRIGGGSASSTPLPYAKAGGALAAMYNEGLRLLKEEPDDIRTIRLGLNGDAGSYGQYFSVWHMAHSQLHQYVVSTLYPMIKLAREIDVSVFKTVFRRMVPDTEYMAFLGLKEFHKYASVMRDEIERADSPDRIVDVLRNFLFYAYRICSWSYLYFPWYIGVFFGRNVNGQEQPGRVTHPETLPGFAG